MKRIVMMVIRNIFILPYMWIKLNYHAHHVDKYTDEEHNKVFKEIVYHANKGGNVKLEAFGVENIPEKNGFIFYPNHQGLYDVLAITGVCPKPFSVVAKKEVMNVPLLKQVFMGMKAYMIERDNLRQSMEIIINVANEVKKGRNYLIFAEGTRSKKGNNTIEFKGGSFKSATKARAPIVPIALFNSFVPFDSKTLKKVVVEIHFLEPLLYEEYKEMHTNDIAKEVRTRIQTVLDSRKEVNE